MLGALLDDFDIKLTPTPAPAATSSVNDTPEQLQADQNINAPAGNENRPIQRPARNGRPPTRLQFDPTRRTYR